MNTSKDGCFLSHLRFALVLLLLAASPSAPAQQASLPTVTFTLDFPSSTPDHYVITVDSAGHTTYASGQSSAKKVAPAPTVSTDSDAAEVAPATSDEPFEMSFVMSEANRAHIFRLAERAGYFAEELEYKKGRIANTGTKTLAYQDGKRHTQSSFNYTANAPAQELTALFQNISTTLECGHRLQYAHRYQKLALDEELKRMEEMDKQHTLAELQALAPILKQIVADSSVMNVSRSRAQRLLEHSAAH